MRNETKYWVRMSSKTSWKLAMKAGSRQRGWMRVTLTKHRGHGAKPLSRENKEILSSFVKPSSYLCLPAAFSVSADFYLTAPFSFTYFYLFLFAPIRIITRLFSSFVLFVSSFYRLLWPDLATLIRILIPCSQPVSFTLSKLHSWTCPKRNVIFPLEVFRNLFRFRSKILK